MNDETRTHQEDLIRLIDQQYRPEPLHRGELDILRTRIRARSERPRRASWPAWGARWWVVRRT